MGDKTLFIGWGDVVKLYYWEYLKKYFYQGNLKPVIAEVSKKAKLASGFFEIWGSPKLDRMIREGIFNRIFILTPPAYHMSQVMHCLDVLSSSKSRCDIYVEKPVDIEREIVRACIDRITKVPNSDCHQIRVIDHYTQKWTSRWLYDEGEKAFLEIGPVKNIYFVSYETIPMADSAAFSRGYAREHGIHAWAMISHCFPVLRNADVSLDTKVNPPLAWRYNGCPEICAGESAFLITYEVCWPNGSRPGFVNNNLRITIASGKAMTDKVKKLMFDGKNGQIVAHFNDDKIFVKKRDSKFEEINTSAQGYPKQPAYKTIVEGIFGEEGEPRRVTIELIDGLDALDRIEMAAQRFEDPIAYKQGETPSKLIEVQRNCPI
jgi:hypothetical protein